MTSDTRQRYVFEVIDRATRCIVYDTGVHDLAKFCELFDLDPASIEPGASYEFEASAVASLLGALRTECAAVGRYGLLRPSCLTDQLPYTVHTNRELVMMLAGTKPLAVFSDTHPSTLPPFEVIPEDVYAPYVEAGRLVRRELIVMPSNPIRELAMRIVCYALPTETWRIDAYLLLHQQGDKFGWSETCERMEGTLFGYTDEQIDMYIEMIYQRNVASV